MKFKLKQIVIATILLISIGSIMNAQTSDEVRDLLPNQNIEREMTGKATHQYKFDLKKDEFFQVRVEQKGVDVALKLSDGKGNILTAMDSPNGKEGFETLTFVANENAGFILEVISPNEKAEKGIYIISRAASHTATEKDKRRVEVEKIFVEGIKASDTEGQSEIAIAKLEDALRGYQEIKEVYLSDLIVKQIKAIKLKPRTDALIAEFKAPQKLVTEGQKLMSVGTKESLESATKLMIEAVESSRKFFVRIDNNELNDILTKEDKADWKLIIKLNEANAQSALGSIYGFLKEWDKSIEYNKLAIEVTDKMLQNSEIRSSKYFSSIFNLKAQKASILGNIATMTSTYLNKPKESFPYFDETLALWREVQKEDEKLREYALFMESLELQNLGQSYKRLNDRQKALENLENSLQIIKKLPNQKQQEASLLSQIGVLYGSQLNYEKELHYKKSALNIYEEIDNKPKQAGILKQIGFIYFALNDEKQAKEYFSQVLTILLSKDYLENLNKNKDSIPLSLPNGSKAAEVDVSPYYADIYEATRYLDIGNIYGVLGEKDKQLEYLEKSLGFARSSKNLEMITLVLSFIGGAYSDKADWNKSLNYYKQSLEISRQLPDKNGLASDLINLANLYIETKELQKALQNANEALLIYQSLGADKDDIYTGYVNSLNSLARIYNELGNKKLAILYGKQVVNGIQRERQQLQNLEKTFQKAYLDKNEKLYRRLAEWLIESGRLVEAEQVLAMLKQEEVADYLRRDRAFAEKLNLRIDFTPKEKEALAGYQKKSETLSAIGAEFSKLEDLKRKGVKLTDEQEKRFEELDGKLKIANQDFQNFLDELAKEFGKGKDSGIGEGTRNSIQGRLAGWGEGVQYIYTAVGENLNVVLYSSDVNVSKTSTGKMTAAELNEKIFAFRAAVKNPKVDPRPLGKELYDVLIKPFETELDAAKAKTILWSLDGNLRLLPLAALWDGKQYLGLKYQNVVFTEASLSDVDKQFSTNPNVLALGVSDAKTVEETLIQRRFTFDALPAVPFELGSIVKTKQTPKGVLSGVSLLNDGFTRKSFAEQLLKGYKIVHIASHFSMNAGDASRSFLLLGDGTTLTVNELNIEPAFKQKFQGVELLTLSACDTAVGETDSNGKEVEGFAYVAQQNGARAILATLWSVADESTALLMSEFYRLRRENPQMSKAEAMQKVQSLMINGKLKPSGKQTGCRSGVFTVGEKQTEYKCDTNAPFSHPFYWSPFVLIGNWK